MIDAPFAKPALIKLDDQSVYTLDGTTIIGRHEDCHLVLKAERGASRKHARITIENNAVVLMDLGSLNGTLVNDREISQAVQLSHGDIIVFDQQQYRFIAPNHTADTSSDAVTVIDNKADIANPASLKPSIKRVDVPQHSNRSIAEHAPSYSDEYDGGNKDHYDETNADFDRIPATSRPGGDAPAKRAGTGKFKAGSKKSGSILKWLVLLPLLLVVLLAAFYYAYSNGLITHSTTTSSGSQ